MSTEAESIAEELRLLAERIADEALTVLRRAANSESDEDQIALRASEKRLTRARRAVEKAVGLLDGELSGDAD